MGTRVVILALLLWSSVAHAQLFMVQNVNDAGTGSLRAAIIGANPVGGSIIVDTSGTIVLASPLPALQDLVTITGPGAATFTVQGSATVVPVFSVAGNVTLTGMTITGGANASGNGGGIAVTSGSLALNDSVVSGNSAQAGAAVVASANLTIRRSTITGNDGASAVLVTGGNTTVIDSAIASNQGTAIVFTPLNKTLTINRSTISGNTSASGVGGLQLQGGTANVRNTTFSGNTGAQAGDFWTFSDGVTLSLLNVTAVGGSAPALLFDHASIVNLRNTLFAGTGARCGGGHMPTSQGHNLSVDTTCNLTGTADKPGMDPMLGALTANGGTTKTHLPMANSPALNAGDGASVETMDQRGKMRVQFGVVDIGAVEAVEPLIATQPEAPQSLVEGDMLTLTIVAMNQDSTAALKFQWRKDATAITGATAATFTKPDATPADSGMYDVLVTNEGGTLASKAVAVTVTAAVRPDSPDGGGDGGGCCSAAGDGGASSALLALLLAARLGLPRRRTR
ncbi:MAG TPA: right-handed parallel beta-helix repeat-containing protein [Kofleriaceae bacterium]|nr:right-handed parallel beta-helix repeat-containing protein [Kofleriaceae bacterium]